MKTTISFALAMAAFLFATAIEAYAFGQITGWLGMFFFVGVFVMVLHRLQLQRRLM